MTTEPNLCATCNACCKAQGVLRCGTYSEGDPRAEAFLNTEPEEVQLSRVLSQGSIIKAVHDLISEADLPGCPVDASVLHRVERLIEIAKSP